MTKGFLDLEHLGVYLATAIALEVDGETQLCSQATKDASNEMIRIQLTLTLIRAFVNMLFLLNVCAA